MTLPPSCSEAGQGGLNEVEEAGDNFWIENVEGGSNQTYLLLRVGISALNEGQHEGCAKVIRDGWLIGTMLTNPVSLMTFWSVSQLHVITSLCVDLRLNLY